MLRFTLHDPVQLELKRVVPLDGSGPHTMDVWFWLPNQLGFAEPTFDRAAFYADLTSYVRFATPHVEPAGMLARLRLLHEGVRALAAEPGSGGASGERGANLERELREFAAISRGMEREGARAIRARLQGGEEDRAIADLRGHIVRGEDTLCRYRTFGREAAGLALPAPWPALLSAVEDFLSQQAIEAWYLLLAHSPHFPAGPAGAGAREHLTSAIRAETARRVEAGLHGKLDPGDDAANELFVTRMNALKKYVLGVLHVRGLQSRRARMLQDLLFGFAAALAMLVTVLLQVWTAWHVGMPTGPGPTLGLFIAIAVGGYILKDRSKEWLKGWFAERIPQWLYDERVELVAEGGRFGAVEETVRLLRPGDTPREVIALRNEGEEPFTAGERAREDVVHYRRSAWVDRAAAPRGMEALDDILRFQVQRWLRRMDAPIRGLSELNEDDTVIPIPAAKVYCVQVILSAGTQLQRYTVVLNKTGAVRLERIADRTGITPSWAK